MLFSTRRGGVSGGPVRLAQPRPPDRRRRAPTSTRTATALAAAVGLPARALPATAARSTAPTVRRATEPPGAGAARRRGGRPGDRARATPPALVFVADCLPVLLAADGAVAALHCGWRGLAGGHRRRGRRGAARARRATGRSPPRSAPARAAAATRSARRSTRASPRYDARARRAQPRPRRRSRARQLAAAGVDDVHDAGLCTMCWRRCSSPTAATAASPAARRGSCGGPDHRPRRRANAERVRAEIAAAAQRAGARPGRGRAARRGQVRRRSRSSARSPRPGSTLLGENRAQELEAKAAAHPELPLALHRPAPEPQGQADPAARGADPLGRVGLGAAPARAPRHAGDRDPGRGQRRGGGGQGRHRPGRARRLPRALPGARSRA